MPRKGHPWTPEAREAIMRGRMAGGNMGKHPRTPETRAKLSETMKARWQMPEFQEAAKRGWEKRRARELTVKERQLIKRIYYLAKELLGE